MTTPSKMTEMTIDKYLAERPLIPEREEEALRYLHSLSDQSSYIDRAKTWGFGRSLADEAFQRLYWGVGAKPVPYNLTNKDYMRFYRLWKINPRDLGEYLDLFVDQSLRYQTTAPSAYAPMLWPMYEVLMPTLYMHGYDFPAEPERAEPDLVMVEPATEIKRIKLVGRATPTGMNAHANDALKEHYGLTRSLTDVAYYELFTRPYKLTPERIREALATDGKWNLNNRRFWKATGMARKYRNQIMSKQRPITKAFYKNVMPVLYLNGYDFP